MATAIDRNRSVSLGDLIEAAIWLKSEEGENAEYDRALVELVRDVSGQADVLSKDDVAEAVGIVGWEAGS